MQKCLKIGDKTFTRCFLSFNYSLCTVWNLNSFQNKSLYPFNNHCQRLWSLNIKEDLTCCDQAVQTQNMTMYGNSGSFWWLFVRRVREDGVVYHCLPCEDTVRKHVFSMTCVAPVVSDTASGCLVFTVPVHTGTPGGWSPELKPCSTSCRSFFFF